MSLRLERNYPLAIILVVTSAFFLAAQATFVKLASPYANPSMILLSRAVIALISVAMISYFSTSITSGPFNIEVQQIDKN